MADRLTYTRPVVGGDVAAQGTPDMTLAVGAGYVLIANASVAVAAGNVTVTAADATQDRLDAVVVDASGTKSVLAGPVNDGINVQPPDATGYALLATVYVLNQAHADYTGTITNAMLTDMRQAAFVEQPQQAQTFSYTYSTATTSTDPGTATFNFNSTTASAITTMYISYTSATSPISALPWLKQGTSISGVRLSPYLLRLRSRKDPNNWIMLEVLGGSITDHTTFGDMPAKFVAKSNSGSTIPLSTDTYDTIFEFCGVAPVTYLFDTANLTGDVTMTNANQFYDGPSLASIGTSTSTIWLDAYITVLAGANLDKITAKLWNGTATVAEGGAVGSNVTAVTIHLSGIRQPGGAETWKISAASTGAGGTVKAAASANSAGNFASRISYMRIN